MGAAAVMAAGLVLHFLSKGCSTAEAAAEESEEDPSDEAADGGGGALGLCSASSADCTSVWALVSIAGVVGASWSQDDNSSGVVVASARSAPA